MDPTPATSLARRTRRRSSQSVRRTGIRSIEMRSAAIVITVVLWMAATSQRVLAQAGPSEAPIAASPIVLPASDIKWVQVRPGQETSVLWGDPRSGPYGRFNKFAAAFDDRPHYHSRDLRAVITSGTLV